jgi:hypothetical protein
MRTFEASSCSDKLMDSPIINSDFMDQEVRGMNYPNLMNDIQSVILVARRGKNVHIENDLRLYGGEVCHFSACSANLQHRSAHSAVFNASHSGVPV